MANADDSFSAESLRPFESGNEFSRAPPLIAKPPVAAAFPHVCGSQPSVRPGTVAPASEV